MATSGQQQNCEVRSLSHNLEVGRESRSSWAQERIQWGALAVNAEWETTNLNILASLISHGASVKNHARVQDIDD